MARAQRIVYNFIDLSYPRYLTGCYTAAWLFVLFASVHRISSGTTKQNSLSLLARLYLCLFPPINVKVPETVLRSPSLLDQLCQFSL